MKPTGLSVLMLLNNLEPPYGGPELQALQMAAALRRRGVGVLFLAKGSGRAPAYEEIDGFPVHRLRFAGAASLQALWMLYRLRDRYGIIHVHGVGRLASVAIRFARAFDRRVVVKVTTAGHLYKGDRPGLRGLLRRLSPFPRAKLRLLRQVDAIIAISAEIAAELAACGFPPEKAVRVPNGVDTGRFRPAAPEEREALRRRLGLPAGRFTVVFSGRITRRKGVDTLMEAWRQSAARQKWTLVLLGAGEGFADSLEEWVSQYIAEHRMDGAVVRAGAVPDVQPWLTAADAFVLPSRQEGLSNALLEAMASGLTCIASDIGGNAELIRDGATGLLVPVSDAAALAAALDSAAETAAARDHTLGQSARALVRDHFGLEAVADRLTSLYLGIWR